MPRPSTQLSTLHERLDHWFADHGRDLPWRDPACSAWGVMVSEFMLQQTPVARVLPLWTQWMERWPHPADLAAAPSAEVLRAWGGLGYPRRAMRLQAAAQRIVDEHGGRVPDTEEELLALPGVGSYTAAAVACFAYGRPTVVVDTNIRRVHARLIGGQALPEKSLTVAEQARARALMPQETGLAVRWNASVMELGALICTARSPRCTECPVQDLCAWQAAGCPAPHYQPRGQAWAGTDRQLRGAIMAVLREQDEVSEQELRSLVDAGGRLGAHEPRPEQWDRCLDSLAQDGLVRRRREELPGAGTENGPGALLSLPG